MDSSGSSGFQLVCVWITQGEQVNTDDLEMVKYTQNVIEIYRFPN